MAETVKRYWLPTCPTRCAQERSQVDCPAIAELAYAEFSRQLHARAAAERIPLAGSIELTARCNLRCVHCYVARPADDRHAQQSEMTCDDLCRVIDQVADAGCLWLSFTGGEPFVRPDFLKIYTYARQKGLLVTILTNGTAINRQIADHLAQWRPFSLEITLYGHSRETYERVTRVAGSFDQCHHAIELLRERNLPLKLKTSVLSFNRHEVEALKRYAEQIGVEFRFDPLLNVGLDGNRRPAQFRISPEQVVCLDLLDPARVAQWRNASRQFEQAPPNPGDLFHCGAALYSFHIDPCGRLSPCLMCRVPNYDLRRGTFREGWFDFLPQTLSQRRSDTNPCRQCALIPLCNQCPGWALLEHGDPDAPVEYLCQIARLRAKALGSTKADRPRYSQGQTTRELRGLPALSGPKPLSSRLFSDLVADLLARGYGVRFRASGRSMLPTIAEGEAVTVEPLSPAQVKCGDVVLYCQGNRVIVHRVTAVTRDGRGKPAEYVLCGDAPGSGAEGVFPAQILGKVVSVQRRGRQVRLSGRRAKLARSARARLSQIKRWISSLLG